MTTGVSVEAGERAWIVTAGLALVATVCLVVLFWSEAEGAYRVWVQSTAYNHCFLVLPLVGYMIWNRREVLSTTAPTPQLRWLVIVPVLSALWLAAASLGIHEAQQLIVATILQAILLSTLGWTAYRRLLAPLLYLYFLIPTGEFLVPFLQDFTASMAVDGLKLVGVPVFSDGFFIEVPAGKFVVAEECAGLRFLIASVAFGVFFAVITYRSYVRRAAFIVLSILVPVVANGARAFGIVYAAEIVGSPAAVMADHVIYGWGFFSAILVLLMLLGRSFADRHEPSDDRPLAARPIFFPARCALAALLGVALAGLGPAYAAVLDRQSTPDFVTDAKAPQLEAPWSEVTSGLVDDWSPVVYGADRIFRDALTDGDTTVYRFVALYLAHGRINNLIRSENRVADESRWRIATGNTATIDVDGRLQRVNISEIVSGDRRRLVVSYYVVDGSATAGVLSAKLYQLRSLLSSRRQLSAFVAIAINMPDRSAPSLATAARLLATMRTFPNDLRVLSER
jgi:exosortase A